MDKFLAGAKALKEAGAAAITLADNSLAILRVSNFAAAIRVREEVGLTSLLHLACRDRNLLGLQSEIMGLGTLGFRHVLALTGDPAKVGDHPGATSVYDLNSVGLIKLLAGMNRGVNHVGRPLNGQTKFIIGCAFNPNALNFDSQVKKLESKLAAGAQYVMTQPVFDLELARRTVARLKPLGVPIFLGVMPLLSSRNAEFLHNEVPGIKIAEPLRERLRHLRRRSRPRRKSASKWRAKSAMWRWKRSTASISSRRFCATKSASICWAKCIATSARPSCASASGFPSG